MIEGAYRDLSDKITIIWLASIYCTVAKDHYYINVIRKMLPDEQCQDTTVNYYEHSKLAFSRK